MTLHNLWSPIKARPIPRRNVQVAAAAVAAVPLRIVEMFFIVS